MLFPSCINKNGTAEISAAPEKKAQNTTDACPSSPTLSFYLRDSAAFAALHLRYPSPGFSRATSILSPHPVRRAPESFTPSAGFRRFPKNFVCRFLNCGITIPRPRMVVNTIFRQFVRLAATYIRVLWTKRPSTFSADGLLIISKTPGYSPAHPAECPGRGRASPFSVTPARCNTGGHHGQTPAGAR